jgi:hypothetical protein
MSLSFWTLPVHLSNRLTILTSFTTSQYSLIDRWLTVDTVQFYQCWVSRSIGSYPKNIFLFPLDYYQADVEDLFEVYWKGIQPSFKKNFVMRMWRDVHPASYLRYKINIRKKKSGVSYPHTDLSPAAHYFFHWQKYTALRLVCCPQRRQSYPWWQDELAGVRSCLVWQRRNRTIATSKDCVLRRIHLLSTEHLSCNTLMGDETRRGRYRFRCSARFWVNVRCLLSRNQKPEGGILQCWQHVSQTYSICQDPDWWM